MDNKQIIRIIYSVIRDPLEYIYLILKFKKLPHCLIKELIKNYLIPKLDSFYLLNDILVVPKTKFGIFIHISNEIDDIFRICKYYPGTFMRYTYNFAKSPFSKKFIRNYLNVIPITCEYRHELINTESIIYLPKYLQKKFNEFCERKGMFGVRNFFEYYLMLNNYLKKTVYYKLCINNFKK